MVTRQLDDTPAPENAKNWKPTVEIGQVGLRRFAGYLSEEFDPDLRGQKGMKRYDEMRRNDPDVGAILWAIEMSMMSVEWSTEPGGETPADEEAAEFLKQCWEDMSMSPNDLISDIITMFPFGFHLGEIVYKIRQGEDVTGTLPDGQELATSKYDDGKIGWRKIAPRNQETIVQWDYDEHGGLRGAWQQLPTGMKRIYLPIEKCILFTTRRERGNPEGYSILRNAWLPYYVKTNMQEIEVISAERDMTGIPYLKLPVGASEDDKDAALGILEKLKWDDQAGIVLPRLGADEHQQWEFGTVSSPGSPRIDPDKVIQRCIVAITRSVLAQFITLGTVGGTGSYALSRDHQDLFHLAIKGWLDRIEYTINKYMVARLFKLNNMKLDELPRLKHGQVGKRQIDIFVDALGKLYQMGMPVLAEDWNVIRNEIEMPLIPEDKVEDISKNLEHEEEVDIEKKDIELEHMKNPPQPIVKPGQPPVKKAATEKWYSEDYNND